MLYLFRNFCENLLAIEYFTERSYVALNVDAFNIFNWLENLSYDDFAHLAFKFSEKDEIEQIR